MHPAVNLEDFRRRARRRLPRVIFDYLEGGADGEQGLTRNRTMFGRILFEPQRLLDVSQRDSSVMLFGRRYPAPLILAPIGLAGAFWADGEVALARAAAAAGLPCVLSTAAATSVEEVARRGGCELWFQLYVLTRELADALVARAKAAGCTTLVLTVDVPVPAKRERDLRNGYAVPLRPTPRLLLDLLRHPAWTLQRLPHGMPQLAHYAGAEALDLATQAALMRRHLDASYAWKDLHRLRDRWPGTLLVKGILTAEDAARCIACGVDGVVLSNHGGRQLADMRAPIEVLPAVASQIAAPALIDSGVRDGTDVVKAMALGAHGVMLGRSVLYGLAAAGEAGVRDVIRMIIADIDRTLALIGCARMEDLGPQHVSFT